MSFSWMYGHQPFLCVCLSQHPSLVIHLSLFLSLSLSLSLYQRANCRGFTPFDQKNIWLTQCFGLKKFGQHSVFGPKTFWSFSVLAKKHLANTMFGRKTFGPHTVLTKEHLSNTLFWPKNIWPTQCLGQKRFGQHSVLAKETFCPHSVLAKTICVGQQCVLAKTIWPKQFFGQKTFGRQLTRPQSPSACWARRHNVSR